MREWLVKPILNSGTVGHWTEADGGGSGLLLSALFKLLEGPVGCCMPASYIFDAVFVAILWPPKVSVSLCKYPVKELMWDAGTVHANHIARPAKLGLCNHGLYADKARSIQDFSVKRSRLTAIEETRELLYTFVDSMMFLWFITRERRRPRDWLAVLIRPAKIMFYVTLREECTFATDWMALFLT